MLNTKCVFETSKGAALNPGENKYLPLKLNVDQGRAAFPVVKIALFYYQIG